MYGYLLQLLKVVVTSINSFKMASASVDLHTTYTAEHEEEGRGRREEEEGMR